MGLTFALEVEGAKWLFERLYWGEWSPYQQKTLCLLTYCSNKPILIIKKTCRKLRHFKVYYVRKVAFVVFFFYIVN